MLLQVLRYACSREKVVIKRVPELSDSERTQLYQIIRRYYPTVPSSFIKNRIEVDQGFDVVMIQEKGLIQGVSYYNISTVQTPFADTSTPVVHFGQAMKR
jgi:hypothetical protein